MPSIKGNNSSGLISVPSGDVTVLNNDTSTRWAVGAINLHTETAVGDTVELFKSPDATSASGERIDRIVMAGDDTQPGLFTPFNLEAGLFLIATSTTGGLVNIEAIYTAYTGDS